MSLNAREQQTLASIEDRLTGSDPELASLLATFTRLTAGEEFPARENIGARQLPSRLRGKLAWLLLCLVVSIALIAVGLIFGCGSRGGHGSCSSWPVLAPCAMSASTHAARYPHSSAAGLP